ncbi:response regulator transcription factor [Mucilaginibacter sp.]|uniref:response regulator n=1 Tax=Mucilaginibacter sp. TaxID=1882438 RepID=UPI0025DE36A7|nr:response regulator transcription factor [Mucilaginibacter sp.]
MINIILVEDHPLVIAGINFILANEQNITCMASCATATDLYSLLKNNQPDVILMDINLPDANGIELCAEVKKRYPAIHILALSTNNQPGIIKKMMNSGASGYLLKDAPKQEIIEAIENAVKGKNVFSRSAALAMRKPDHPDFPPLTRREREILELIADGFTTQEIAGSLFVDVTTIDSHRKNMIAKYNVKNTTALVKLAVVHRLI